MFKINNIPVEPSLDSIISRQVELVGDKYRAEFGFIEYGRHPLLAQMKGIVPNFSSMRYTDRTQARRAFSAIYQKLEFANYAAKISNKNEPVYECVNLLTEKGTWWGMLLNNDGSKPRNPNAIISAANHVLNECETDDKNGSNPFCLIYSGIGFCPTEEKDFKRIRMFSEEFGGMENIPMDHPFFVKNIRIMCVAQVRVEESSAMVIASINKSEIGDIRNRITPKSGWSDFIDEQELPKLLSPASTFRLDFLEETDASWNTVPHVDFKSLAKMSDE